jgi:hypothetical protein
MGKENGGKDMILRFVCPKSSLSKGSWSDGMIHQQLGWENGACVPTQEYITKLLQRTLDAINRYNPD